MTAEPTATPFAARTAEFLAALASRNALHEEKRAHFTGMVRLASAAIREAVNREAPKKIASAPAEEKSASVEDLYRSTFMWGCAMIGRASVVAAEAPFLLDPHMPKQEWYDEQIKATEREIARLALFAVFPCTAERTKVYTPPYGVYRSQGWGEGSCLEADCAIRVAILQARGFAAITEHTDQAGHHVVANAPPEIAHALRYWRLDDQRLILATNPANLKVLFGERFPFAGAWDWPEAKRERRDHASFDAHRANEEAHLNLNRG